MGHRTARRPTPVIHVTLKPGGFGGERCPLCNITKLASTTRYPICHPCQKKYGLTDDLLEKFSGHRIMIEQEEIGWRRRPYPVLTGTIDEVGWEAHYVDVKSSWFVVMTDNVENLSELRLVMESYLNLMTPVWIHSADTRKKKTQIRRYAFVAAAGVTLVTAAYVVNKLTEKEAKAKKLAEQVEAKRK